MKLSKKLYAGGFVAAGVAMMAALGAYGGNIGMTPEDKPAEQQKQDDAVAQRANAFMEDKTDSEEAINIEKAVEEIAEMNENLENPHPNETPNTIGFQGHNYFLYGDGMLLPIGEEWKEYVVQGAKDGSYESISEYYLKEESPENWTQKFTIHKVGGFSDACPEFADRLVNGILVTLSDRMELQGNTLKKEDVSVNFARKEPKDTILYWGMPGLEEVQFVRVFRSEYTNDLYVATSSYRMDISDTDMDFVGNKMAELASIQQLKKKG